MPNIAKNKDRKFSLLEPCSSGIQRNVKKGRRWCFNAFLFSAPQSSCISATIKIYKHLKIMWNQKNLKLILHLGDEEMPEMEDGI